MGILIGEQLMLERIKHYYALGILGFFIALIIITGYMIGVLLIGLWEHGHICTHFMI